MSDTSILGYYDDGQGMDGEPYLTKKNNCWNRCGANVCVGLLTLLVIVLVALLIYYFYNDPAFRALFSLKVKKGKANKQRQKPSKQVPGHIPQSYYQNDYYQGQDEGGEYYHQSQEDEEEEEEEEFDEDDHGDDA